MHEPKVTLDLVFHTGSKKKKKKTSIRVLLSRYKNDDVTR